MQTPQTAQVLAKILIMHQWQQTDLAHASGIDRAQVSMHVNAARPVRDIHLQAYLVVIDRPEQIQLLAAWLRDTLPAQTQAHALEPGSDLVAEPISRWRAALDPEHRTMLDWWADRIATDPELAEVLIIISRRSGYIPKQPANSHDH